MTAVVAKHRGVEVRERLGIKSPKKPVARFHMVSCGAVRTASVRPTSSCFDMDRKLLTVVLEVCIGFSATEHEDRTGTATTSSPSYWLLLRLRVTPRGTAIVRL